MFVTESFLRCQSCINTCVPLFVAGSRGDGASPGRAYGRQEFSPRRGLPRSKQVSVGESTLVAIFI